MGAAQNFCGNASMYTGVKQHVTSTEMYGNEPKLSTKIQSHHLRLAGHLLCIRNIKEPVSQLITGHRNMEGGKWEDRSSAIRFSC